MAKVYSSKLLDESVTVSSSPFFEVTAGFVVVVRDIVAVIEAPSPDVGWRLEIGQGPFTEGTAFFTEYVTPGSFYTARWEGRVVLPGPTLIQASIDAGGGDAQVTVSGYVLTLP